MGIPGLFSYLSKYNIDDDDYSTIKKQIPAKYNLINLFLDFNGGIYQVIKPEIKTNDTLIIYVLEYLDNLIKLFDKKINILYIALDGVPPRAKMEQQRIRRYHSKHKKQKQINLYQKYADKTEQFNINTSINTNIITPGTEFMYKLSNEIKKHISNSELYKDIAEIHFSDWKIPGEGEHKILDFINQNFNTFNQSNTANIIYGLDGDLIMLALSTHLTNIFLLREAYEYGKYAFIHEGYPYLYLDINELKNSILQESNMNMSLSIDDLTYDDECRIIDDYICLMMLLGNDFMPKIKWFTISQNAHQILLEIYFQLFNANDAIDKEKDRQYLYNRKLNKLNHRLLADIIRIISQDENTYAFNFFKKRVKPKPFIDRSMTKYKQELKLLDYLPLKYTKEEIEKIANTLFTNLNNHKAKNIWRNNYYINCFNLSNDLTKHELNNEKNKIIEDYLKTYLWNINYYLQGYKSCDWDWYYPYDYAPTLKDISYYLENNDMKKIKLSTADPKPLTPLELLTVVLPLSDKSLMPTELFKLMHNYKHIFFPETYGINMMLHSHYYECTPIIPKINIHIIRQLFRQTKLLSFEEKLNEIGEHFKIIKS